MSLESGRELKIEDCEALARFAISKSQFSREQKRPKPNLFTPNPHTELSVSRIDDLDAPIVCDLGNDVAHQRGKEKALGYATLNSSDPRDFGLDVIASEPPMHHANITGWSNHADLAEKKRLQLEKAKALVERCSMVFFE